MSILLLRLKVRNYYVIVSSNHCHIMRLSIYICRLGMLLWTHNHKECLMGVAAYLHAQMPEIIFYSIRNTFFNNWDFSLCLWIDQAPFLTLNTVYRKQMIWLARITPIYWKNLPMLLADKTNYCYIELLLMTLAYC